MHSAGPSLGKFLDTLERTLALLKSPVAWRHSPVRAAAAAHHDVRTFSSDGR